MNASEKFSSYKKNVLYVIQRIKSSPSATDILHEMFDHQIYSLEPVTQKYMYNRSFIQLLGNWRRTHEKWFPAQFRVTLQGTQNWMKNRVIGEPDRLLFMIKVKREYIGHIGLYRFNFSHRTCDIDNIIRGENKFPGIMEHAIRTMMQWGKQVLGVKWYTLETTSDNSRALRLYSRLGFVETKRTPLIRIVKRDRMEWKKVPKHYRGSVQRYTVFMKEAHEKK